MEKAAASARTAARCDADREARAAGKLEHQPVLRYALHPGTDIGDE